MTKIIKYILLVLLFFLIIISNCKLINKKASQLAEKGVIDLSSIDIEENTVLELNGEWEFYWKKLLLPSDFKENINIHPEYFNMPSTWNNYKINGKRVGYKGYATYRIKILNCNYDKNISIKIPEMASAYNLYINGDKVASNGIVSYSKEKMTPQYLPLVVDYTLKSKDIEIILQISNFHERLGGFWKSIFIGSKKEIHWMYRKKISFEFFIFGILIVIFLYNISLFVLRRKDYVLLFFGIFCLIIAVRLLVSGEKFINHFFPYLNWEISRKLFAITFFLSVPVFITFIHGLFPNEFKKPVLRVSQIIGIFFCVITLFTYANIYTRIIILYYITTVAFSIYIIYILFAAVYKKREGAVISICGFLFFFITILNDILYSESIIHTGFFVPFGVVVFILFQSFLLSMRFAKAFNKNEKLSIKLEKINKKLTNSNINLENIIEKRTKELKEAHQQKINFFINLAHETKTPLTLINNYFDKYIKNKNNSNEIKVIKHNLEKLKNDMVNFLDLEKLDRGQIFYDHNQVTDFSEVLVDKIVLFKELGKNKKIKMTSQIEKNIFIKIDPYALDRIINNLLDNALKYTNINGNVKIVLSSPDEKIFFKVIDTGIGMTENQLYNIFEPYQQMSNNKNNIQGIGMGLNIVKKIIAEVEGGINVKSKLNNGSIFELIFNKYNKSSNEKVSENFVMTYPSDNYLNLDLGEEIYMKNKLNIFIIDDNQELLFLLKESLIDEYNVFFSINGNDALKKLSKIPKPDIIISDIMMDKMDGYELHDNIIKIPGLNTVPFIYLTAKNSNDDKIKGLEKGAVDYIYKPFTLIELKSKIKSLLQIRKNQKIDDIKNISVKFSKLINSQAKNNNSLPFTFLSRKYNLIYEEKEIVKLLLKGYQNKEISFHLKISLDVVKKYIQKIYKKCKVSKRVELIQKFKN